MRTIFFILLMPIVALGQINQNTMLPDVMPANPAAFQFMKYGEIPVDTYTGTPDISIPIYNLKTKALDIPIILRYHANGIRVNEEASWVGLGWNLNADMQIVQSVVGLDDFGPYRRRSLPDFNCLINIQTGLTGSSVMSQCGTFFLGLDDNWNAQNQGCYFNTEYYAGVWDSEPDIFYFNALGYSGKFVMNWQNSEFVCLTDKRIKIEAPGTENNSPNISTIMITMPDGNKFVFSLKEETTINRSISTSSTGGTVPTNVDMVGKKSGRVFKLTQLVTNKGELINFQYNTTLPSKNFPNISQTHRSYEALTGSNYIPEFMGVTTSYLATQQPFSYLSSIEYNDIRINFVTSGRIDLKEAKKLDKIEVTYKNVVKKQFDFTYDYFVSVDTGNNWNSYLNQGYNSEKTPQELTHRLKLTSVQEIGSNPYLFDYNSQQLPLKTSYASDYWGFYNGMHTNDSFIPNIYSFNVQRNNTKYYDFQQNNNASVLTYCKASILEKVTYPTGGHTRYEYELNRFGNYKAPPASQGQSMGVHINTTGQNPSISSMKAVMIEGGSTIFKGGGILSTRGCTDPEAYSSCYIKVQKFKKELIDVVKNAPNYNNYGILYAMATLGIINNPNTTLYDQYIEEVTLLTKLHDDPEEKLLTNLTYNLSEGIVIFSAHGGCGVYNGTVNSSQAGLWLSYRQYDPLPESDSYGAGLRVKSIKSYSNASTLALEESYDYSAGKLMSPLVYFNTTKTNHDKPIYYNQSGSNCDSEIIASIPFFNQQLSDFLTRYNENPTSQLFHYLTSLNNGFNQDAGCYLGSILQIFTGYKNELFSGNFVQFSTSASGKYVGYDKIVKRRISTNPNDSANGMTAFTYINNADIVASAGLNGTGGGSFTEINIPNVSHYPENGLLLKEEIFDQTNVMKRSQINTYSHQYETCFWGMKTISTDTYAQLLPMSSVYEIKNKYLVGVYPIKSGKSTLKRTEERVFENGIELLNTSEFDYDQLNQLSTLVQSNSNNDQLELRNTYVYDHPGFYFSQGMINRNMISPVIQSTKKINGEVIYQEAVNYWQTPTLASGSSYLITEIMNSNSSILNSMEDRVVFHSFDEYNNVLEMSLKNDKRVCVIWGYKGLYPVVRIENVRYSQLPSSLVNTVKNESDTGTEQDLRDAIDALRSSPALSDAMVTSYTYYPLIGIRSVTDPKGDVITYEYDDYGKLKAIRDKDNNIVTKQEYHFRPQN